MNSQIFMIRNGKYMILIRSSREIKQYYVQISVSGEFPEKKKIYIYRYICYIIYILCICIEFSDTCCISLYLYICIFINIYIYILVYIYTSVYMFISLIIRFGGSRWAAAGGRGGDLAKRCPHDLQNR